MFIARKNASTVDERSKGIDSQDPFIASEIPVAGAIVNPLIGSVTRAVADTAVAQLNTTTVGYGGFGGNDLTDHYKFTAKPGTTYTLIVSTDSANGNIRTDGYADYFDIYFEDSAGTRVTADFQIKELDLRTKMVEFTVPATAAANSTYYVQVDNAFEKPFEYAIALFDKALTPAISVESKANADGTYLVTFLANMDLSTTRPRVDRIEVAGGALGSLVRGADGKSYSATLTPAADSTVDLTVRALTGAFFSRNGDPNVDGEQADNFKLIKAYVPPAPPKDEKAPVLLSVQPDGELQEGQTVTTIRFEFDEDVKEFSGDDITVFGGALSEFTGSGKSYSAKLTLESGNGSGDVKVTVGKDYRDAAGNAPAMSFETTVKFKLKPVDPPPDTGGGGGGGDGGGNAGGDPNVPMGLAVAQEATPNPADTQAVNFKVTHSQADALLTVFLDADGLALPLGEPAKAATLGSLSLVAQGVVTTGELMITDGAVNEDGTLTLTGDQSALPLNLVLVLGTDVVEGLQTGADSLSVATDLPSALYGFGGDDVLVEGANTVVINGGSGVDRIELTPSQGATVVEDMGSPVTLDFLFSLGGLFPAYFGFDLITGFDVGTDTFRFTGKTFAEHKTVVGVYDTLTLNFTPDATGSDLMVFLDIEGNTPDQIDEGEPAVVIVGAAQAVNTPAIGGPGE